MSTEGKGLTVLPQTGKVQGFIKIELIDKKTGSRRIMELNQVTDLGRGVITALGVGVMLSRPQNNVRGNILVDVPFIKLPNVTGKVGNVMGDSTELTCYLANSDEVLAPDSTMLPIYSSDFSTIDSAKLIGYGNNNLTPVDTKNGVRTNVIDTYAVASMDVLLNQWMFDTTQAVGTFNKILMGPGVIQKNNTGIVLARGVNPTPNNETYLGMSRTFFIPPGVSGLTSVDEILIHANDTANQSQSNAVMNLTTGVVTNLEPTDPRYGVEMMGYYDSTSDNPTVESYVIVNGVLYYTAVGGGDRTYIYKNENGVRSEIPVGYIGSSYIKNNTSFGLIHYGTKVLYISSGGELRGYDTETNVTEAVVLNGTITSKYFYGEGTTNDALTNNRVIQLADGTYLLTPCITTEGNYRARFPFKFTDLENIEGSVVGRAIEQSKYLIGESIVGGNTLGFTCYIDDSIGILQEVGNDNSYSEKVLKNNLFILNNSMGNLISYVQLDSPITKTNEQIMYVGYGYRILSQ